MSEVKMALGLALPDGKKGGPMGAPGTKGWFPNRELEAFDQLHGLRLILAFERLQLQLSQGSVKQSVNDLRDQFSFQRDMA